MATYDLANASYDNKFVDVSAQAVDNPGLQGVAFSTDGSKMFIVVDGRPFTSNPNATFQYALSTPWDVTTAVYEKSGPVGDNEPTGITFKPDGTRMYVSGNSNNVVSQYTLATPWDIGTATLGPQKGVFSPSSGPHDVTFSTDGTKMYVADNVDERIYQFDLATAWSVNTATYTAGSNVSVIAQETDVRGIAFNDDGTKMFIVGIAGDTVFQYDLSTPWVVATAVYSGISFFVGANGFPEGLTFSTDGTKMYVAGSSGHDVFQYTVGSLFGITVGFLRLLNPFTPPSAVRILEDGTIRVLEDDVTERILEE